MSRLKEFVRVRAPRTFDMLRRAKRQILVEARVIPGVNLLDILRPALPAGNRWRAELPVQRSLTHRVLIAGRSEGGDSLEWLLSHGRSDGHSVYLDPELFRRSELQKAAEYYPEDAGLKIMRIGSRDHAAASQDHSDLLLVANHLASLRLGPRLYDLTTLMVNDKRYTAYVVQHIAGHVPTDEEWRIGLGRLREACTDSHMTVISPGGFAHTDFRCPDCNGNAVIDREGQFVYLGFQNFGFRRYGTYLKALAREAGAASHIGERSLIRGRNYLYQSIPGVELPARRDPRRRMHTIDALLARTTLSLEGRVVLDVGCNIGMMAAEYLRAGAAWVHGWDRPQTVRSTERVLLAVGCTRFSLTGCDLDIARPIMVDVPAFLQSQLPTAVVSYLAIRGHVGWLTALKTMPWEAMIYEGHEIEDETAARQHLAELCKAVPAEVVELSGYRDGSSTTRVVAIVRRLPA